MGTGGEGAVSRRESGRRWRLGGDDDDEEYVLEDEEEEEECEEELCASSAGEEGESSDKEYEEEEEDQEDETPRPKRPVKGGVRGLKGKAATVRSRRRKYEEDDDYLDELEEDEGVDEYQEDLEQEEEDEAPRPKRMKKCGGGSPKEKLPPVVAGRSNRRRYEEDMDFDHDLDEEEEEASRSNRRRYEEDMNFDHDLDEEEEEARRSNGRRHEEDMDFEPDLDVEEEEDDVDFDPEVEGEEEECEDDEDEEFGVTHTRKARVMNSVRRKPALKQRCGKKKNSSSNVSRRKVDSVKARKSAPVRRRQRKRSMIDHYEEDDGFIDFTVEDQVTVNRQPRKKPRIRRQTEVDPPTPVFETETWPTVDSDTSDFDFVASDEEPEDVEPAIVELVRVKVRKGRKKRIVLSESSSDSEFVVADKKLGNLRESEPPESLQLLPASPRKISVTGYRGYKGKEKKEPEEAGRVPCGICLSEEQRVTLQGVLNCCSHFFCFACIMEWSKVESRCPLCKRRFTTVTKVDLGLELTKSVIRVEERDQVYQPTEEEIRRWLDPYENVVCIECNQGGDDSLMLLCDICDSSAHTYCVGLGREVPEGNWYCGGCRLSGERRSYPRSPVNGNSGLFGATAPNGTFERQGIDLNVSPREISRGNYSVETQASAVGVSTLSGRRATHSRRPQWIHHLFGPRTTIRPDTCHNGVQHSGGSVQRTEPSHMNFCAPSESNISLHHDSVPRSERNNDLHAMSESNASQIIFGRHGSLSERRQLYQHVRNLLSRPMPTSRPDVCHNTAEHNGYIGRTEPNNTNFHASPEANISQTLLDGVRNNNGSSFAQAHSNIVDGNNLEETEGV